MSESKLKAQRQRSEDVADLFRVLRFMSADPDVTEAHFRIAFRIAQFAHVGTSVAKVSDAALMDHLPRTDAKKLRLFRRAIRASGWVRIVEGERGRPTRYVFLDTRIPEVQKRLDAAAAKRDAEFALEKSRELSAMKAAALRARIDAETGEIHGEIRGGYDPLIQPSKGGNLCQNKGAILPPLLPKRPTYKTGYQKEDVTKDAHAPLPAPAPVPARTNPPPPEPDDWLDDEDDTIDISPAPASEVFRAELRARELRRSESGHFMCIDCGTETQLAARYRSSPDDPLYPFCPECIEGNAFDDVKPIAPQRDYAEASRGR